MDPCCKYRFDSHIIETQPTYFPFPYLASKCVCAAIEDVVRLNSEIP